MDKLSFNIYATQCGQNNATLVNKQCDLVCSFLDYTFEAKDVFDR